jgi:dTDP-4-dehydrorhamnose reductase
MLTFDKGAGFYVGSKALAEQVVRQYEKTWICRVRLPFDQYDNPRNYITKLLTYPKIVDAYNSLAHRGDFVKACLDIIELKAPYGTYNMTNPGAIWAHDICKLLQDKGLLKRVNYWNWQEFMDTCARTTKSNAELDTSKLLATGVKMRTVREAIEDSINKFTTST